MCPELCAARMRIGYADPPYPGCAHLYKGHPDYAGEVDHPALIAQLERDFDGWVLHTHTPAITLLAPLVPNDARWGSWVKTFAAFKKGVRPAYAWEPVIFKPCRRMAQDFSGRMIQRDWIACPITLKRGLAGAKPEAVCHWVFEVVGAEKGDELIDLFPGTGAVARAWESWRPQLTLALEAAE
jgi:hypothetical protein